MRATGIEHAVVLAVLVQHPRREGAEVPDGPRVTADDDRRTLSKGQALRGALEHHALCGTIDVGAITLDRADGHNCQFVVT